MTEPAEYITGRTVQEQMNQLIGYVDTRAAEVGAEAAAEYITEEGLVSTGGGSTTVGSAANPVYISSGVATPCTVDASPSSGSDNLVTSGGVYAKTKWTTYTPASWDDFEAYIQGSTKPLVIRIRQNTTWPTGTFCNVVAFYDCNSSINMPVMGTWRMSGSTSNPYEWAYCIVGKTLYCTIPGSTSESAYGLEANIAIGNVTIFSIGE